MSLSDTNIKKHRTTGKMQILRDSPGLFLQISAGKPDQSIHRGAWICRITRKGKTSKSTVGHWPEMKAERARRERDRLTGKNTDMGVSVEDVVGDYRRLVTDRLKSGDQNEVYLRHLLDQHGHRKIATMSRAELVSIIQEYAKDRGGRSADRYLSQLKGVFTLALEQGQIDVSPLAGVSGRITGYHPTPRSRLLSPAEVREVWAWDHRNAALLRFLLLTGLRISEAQKGYREGDRWNVPAHHSKNGKSHWVHLTDTAKAQLSAPFDKSATATQAWLRRRLPEGDRWTPHDLRRSAATLMADNSVDVFVVERVLGHAMQGLLKVYIHGEYVAERTEAAKVLERVVLGIVEDNEALKEAS